MPPKKQTVPKKVGKSYDNLPKPKKAHNMLNLHDKVKFLLFAERRHVFSGSWAVLWEKLIKEPHYSKCRARNHS
jgi:hypothetical protein